MSLPEIPLELKLTLRQGTVYYFQHRDLKSSEPHFFVVANPSPLENCFLVLGVVSSRLESTKARRRFLPPETLVEISPDAYPELTTPSIVDCNSPVYITLIQLVEKLRLREISHHSDLPEKIAEKIFEGLLLSPLIEEKVKNMLKRRG